MARYDGLAHSAYEGGCEQQQPVASLSILVLGLGPVALAIQTIPLTVRGHQFMFLIG